MFPTRGYGDTKKELQQMIKNKMFQRIHQTQTKCSYKTALIGAAFTLFFMAIFAYFFGCSPIGDGYLFHQAGWGKLTYLALCLLMGAAVAAVLCRHYREGIESLSRASVREMLGRLFGAFHIRRGEPWLLAVIVIAGGVLRFVGYNWGVRSIFQPDESNLVRPVLMMAIDRWPYYDYFGYPNMFVSRVAWLCILIWSKFTGTALSVTTIEGYFLFRMVVAFFSTATIPVVYLIGNYIKERLGLIVALLVAVFPEYVCLAKQVTGDSTAFFFMTLLLLASLIYQDKKSYLSVFGMSAFAAMATAEKWHGAVACFYIALVIIFNSGKFSAFIRQGVCAFLSYIGVLSLIAPSLFWNLGEAAGGVVYMYSFDKEDKVYTWGELFLGRIMDFLGYAGVITILFLVVGVWILYRSKNRKYIVLLLGVCKLMAICCLNRGFPRWALEFYFTLLLVIALGIHWMVIPSGRKEISWPGVAWIGRVCALLTVFCLFSGALLATVTAATSRQDTRLVQDAWCDAHGLTKENSMYEYYTGFRPGGINPGKEDGLSEDYNKLGDILQVDEGGRLYKTKEGIDYAIDREGLYDTDVNILLKQQCPVLQSFPAVGPDICYRPVTGIERSFHEPGLIWNNWKQISQILGGAGTGGTIVIYDVSGLPER